MDIDNRPDLYNLVQSDDNIELVRKLLIEGADPNFEYSNGETLIHRAAESTEDNIEIVEELIKAGSNVDRSDNSQYKPLHYAVMYRKRRVIEALLQCKMDINSRDLTGKTALHYAVDKIHPFNVFEHVSCSHGDPDVWIVRKLLDHKDTNVNETDYSSETPLLLAVRHKHSEIVKLLLNHGSKVDVSNETGQTPLHIALADVNPCPFILVLLLLKQSNVFKMNHYREIPMNIILENTSFHIACICLKIIAFNYDININLMKSLIKKPLLFQFLSSYHDEIKRMKSDFITNELTVFDFFGKHALKSDRNNPILEIYKPIVERILSGRYPEYFCYILHRISESNLTNVLKCIVDEKYCIKNKMEKKELWQ